VSDQALGLAPGDNTYAVAINNKEKNNGRISVATTSTSDGIPVKGFLIKLK
jgi:hypothetical protein